MSLRIWWAKRHERACAKGYHKWGESYVDNVKEWYKGDDAPIDVWPCRYCPKQKRIARQLWSIWDGPY